MSNVNINKVMKEVDSRIDFPEQRLGKELLMPFSYASSGARKILFGTQSDHKLQLLNGEVPLVGTGYENMIGMYSSNYKLADQDAKVIAKIPKFEKRPDIHYFMIVLRDDGVLDLIERVSYNHITETYGYLYDNTFIDHLEVGDMIKRNDPIKRTRSFDKYDNRLDGVNLKIAYMACDETTEDAILISDKAAAKLTSPIIKKVPIVINDNDIMLNLYGDDDNYKVIPDIGEEVKDGVLAATRRENKAEALFNQSYDRLKYYTMSDSKYITKKGRVIDIDIYCNNEENIRESIYNTQLNYYWEDRKRYCQSIIDIVGRMRENGYSRLSYELQKLYSDCLKTIEGHKFNRIKPFSNIGLDIIVLEELELKVGDKVANRYGGKGVIGEIREEYKMPRIHGTDEHVDFIYNIATTPNRDNISQNLEQEINMFAEVICNHILYGVGNVFSNNMDVGDALKDILDFIRILNPEQADYYEDKLSCFTDEEVISFIDSMTTDKGIMTRIPPASSNIGIDTLEQLMDRFPYVKMYDIDTYIEGSDGKPRYVKAIRPIVIGYEYVYRLKQYAENKFSTTSLSPTNVRGENSRSKAASLFKDVYTKTPIRFGDMEIMTSAHLGMDAVVFMLMLNATSPSARRRAEEMLTNNTIEVEIKLGDDDSSRVVESLNAYLKTMGIRIVFEKIPKLKRLFVRRLYHVKPKRKLFEVIKNNALKYEPFKPIKCSDGVYRKPLFINLATEEGKKKQELPKLKRLFTIRKDEDDE